MGRCCSIGMEFQFYEMDRVVGVDSDDDLTIFNTTEVHT